MGRGQTVRWSELLSEAVGCRRTNHRSRGRDGPLRSGPRGRARSQMWVGRGDRALVGLPGSRRDGLEEEQALTICSTKPKRSPAPTESGILVSVSLRSKTLTSIVRRIRGLAADPPLRRLLALDVELRLA